MENYKHSSIFDSLEERYEKYEIEKAEFLCDIATLFFCALIVVAVMCLIAKQFNLF